MVLTCLGIALVASLMLAVAQDMATMEVTSQGRLRKLTPHPNLFARHVSSRRSRRICSYYSEDSCSKDELARFNIQAGGSSAMVPDPLALHLLVDGEPIPRNDPNGYDIAFLAGGSNKYANAAYYPFLLSTLLKVAVKKPMLDQSADFLKRPIDVLYQSSNCVPAREALAQMIGDACREAGLIFRYSGSCTAGQPKDCHQPQAKRKNDLQRSAKLMIAFEITHEDYEYLSEKVMLPMVSGSIPLYQGNGQHLMDSVRVNKERILDRASYNNDRSFVDAVIGLLKDEKRLAAFAEQPLFHGEVPVDTRSYLPLVSQDVETLLSRSAKVKALRDRQGPAPTIFVDPPTAFRLDDVCPLFAHLLGVPKVVLADKADQHVDIFVKQCCW